MIAEKLKERCLPDVLRMNDGSACTGKRKWEQRRSEILDLFSREVYGYMPPAPERVKSTIISTYETAVAGFAAYYRIRISFDTPKGPFSFDAEVYLPTHIICAPVLLHLQFNDSPLFRVWPVEDIIKRGFATVMVRYQSIMQDKNDFSQGLAGMYLKENERGPSDWGAIGAWAFGASRVLDALEQWGCVDVQHTAVVGHSRLGKTAMWCAANDPRVQLAVINGSGNSGACLSRGNEGETVADITKMFPHWFCPNYWKYADHEREMPFDQHFLLAALAPRRSYNCSGSEDVWAAPFSEFLCSAAASRAYEMLGLPGLVAPDREPMPGDFFSDGYVAYSMHDGGHYIGRFEWENTMALMERIMRERCV